MRRDHSDKSIGTLLGDALEYLTRLVRAEVTLAKAEMRENVRAAGTGLVLVLAAIVIALSGLNVLSAALVSVLVAQGMSPVWAALAVAAFLCLVAAIFAWLGFSALRPSKLMPTRTAESLRRDAETIKEIVRHDPTE